MIFTDKNQFKSETADDRFYCYMDCDFINIIKIVFEFDLNGLLLKTDDSELKLERHRLLKYWDSIIENYRSQTDGLKKAYVVEDG